MATLVALIALAIIPDIISNNTKGKNFIRLVLVLLVGIVWLIERYLAVKHQVNQ